MSTQYVLGVDPGKHGGFCAVDVTGKTPHVFIPVPLQGMQVCIPTMIKNLVPIAPHVVGAAMEDVHSIFGASAKSNFQFGWVNGAMEAALHAAGITDFVKVQPKTWQRTAWMGVIPVAHPTGKLTKKGEPAYKVDTKATSLRAAASLYPAENFLATPRSKVPHDGWIDAALIAYWLQQHLTIAQQAPRR